MDHSSITREQNTGLYPGHHDYYILVFYHRGGDCTKNVGSLCARFVDMGALVKTQVENGLIKLINFQGQTIDVYDQTVFILKDSGLNDE